MGLTKERLSCWQLFKAIHRWAKAEADVQTERMIGRWVWRLNIKIENLKRRLRR